MKNVVDDAKKRDLNANELMRKVDKIEYKIKFKTFRKMLHKAVYSQPFK